MLDVLANGYDWEEAFKYASGEWATGTGKEKLPPEPFDREDVAEVVALDEGYNDGDNWIVLGRLKTGRWFFLSAGCDYTGWDCQAGGRAYIADALEQLEALVLTVEDKQRLKRPGSGPSEGVEPKP